MDRREFLITSGMLGAAIAAGCTPGVPPASPARPRPAGLRGEALDLALGALDSARAAGAAYADVRVQRNRQQLVSTRERQIAGLADSDSFGFGVRVIANGSWGFAASSEL
ncbi:MAG TPA: DNA gyrase modulator, partial [Egibacteraceae bacterium]|nr:DNA gyrase modulator [Egibacteraceae bacterium]